MVSQKASQKQAKLHKLENSRFQDPTFKFPNSKKIGEYDNLKNVDQSFSMEDSDEINS